MTLRLVIIDDEPLARRRLTALVERTRTRVVGHARTSDEALELIKQLDPDVALVDIHMPPGESGLMLARKLGARPIVIFTTAHAAHAVDAFDAAAADYLVKPIELDRLARALDRAASRLAMTGAEHEPRITARSCGDIHVFAARAITRFRAEDKYTVFVVAGVEYVLEEALTAIEQRLAPWGFLRVHRGELVQVAAVRALRAGELELVDGQRVPVSRRALPAVRRALVRGDRDPRRP